MSNITNGEPTKAKVENKSLSIRFSVEISPEAHELLAQEHARNGGSIAQALERLISRGSLSVFALETLRDGITKPW